MLTAPSGPGNRPADWGEEARLSALAHTLPVAADTLFLREDARCQAAVTVCEPTLTFGLAPRRHVELGRYLQSDHDRSRNF